MTGILPIPMDFHTAGKTVTISVADLTHTFTLDAKGKAGDANNKFTLTNFAIKGKKIGTSGKFSWLAQKQNLYDLLKSLGLENAPALSTINFPVTISHAGHTAVDIPRLVYKVKGEQRGAGRC